MKTMLWAEDDVRTAMEKFERLFGEEHIRPRPAVDAFTRDGTLVFEVELPGVDIEEDVTIELIDDVLKIEGTTEHDSEYDREGFHMTERRFGSFLRQWQLPDGVDPEAITASYDAGVLTVRVPLPEEAGTIEPRKIAITHD